MSGNVRRGLTAGLAGALLMALALTLVAPSSSAAQERARRQVDDALARSGVSVVGGPRVDDAGVLEEPGRALALLGWCLGAGVGLGLVAAAAADRHRSVHLAVGAAAVAGVLLLTLGGRWELAEATALVGLLVGFEAWWWWQGRAVRPAGSPPPP